MLRKKWNYSRSIVKTSWSEIFSWKLINGGVLISSEGSENFRKINKRPPPVYYLGESMIGIDVWKRLQDNTEELQTHSKNITKIKKPFEHYRKRPKCIRIGKQHRYQNDSTQKYNKWHCWYLVWMEWTLSQKILILFR